MSSRTSAARLGALLRLARRTFRPDIPTAARCADAIRDQRLGDFNAATLRGAETGHSRASENLVVAYEKLCDLPTDALLAWRTALRANPDWRDTVTAPSVAVVDELDGLHPERAFGRLLRCARQTFKPAASHESVAEAVLGDAGSGGVLTAFEEGHALPADHVVEALERCYDMPAGSLRCWRAALWNAAGSTPAPPVASPRASVDASRGRSPQPVGHPEREPPPAAPSPQGRSWIPRARRTRIAAAAGMALVLLVSVVVVGVTVLGQDTAQSTTEDLPPAASDPGAACVPRAGAGGDDRATLVGRILTPRSGESITSRVFYATGTLKGEISRGRHAWLAARLKAGLVPKDDEIATARWRVRVEEPFADRLDLVLLKVDEEGHEQINDWLRDGLRTGEYPPFDLPGAIVLDVTCDVHLSSRKPVT